MANLHLIIGDKFNRWTIIDECALRKRGQIMWRCQCDCGTIKEVAGSTIKNGRSKSCGCLQKESVSSKRLKGAIAQSTEYYAWQGMKRRCHNPCHPDFKNFGAKGIHVCSQWFESFDTFLHDMGSRPDNANHIKRINDKKGYSPDNCSWNNV